MKFIVRFGTLEIPNCVTLLLVDYKYMTDIWQHGVVVFLHGVMIAWHIEVQVSYFGHWPTLECSLLLFFIFRKNMSNQNCGLYNLGFLNNSPDHIEKTQQKLISLSWDVALSHHQTISARLGHRPDYATRRLCHVVVSLSRPMTFYSSDAVACMMQYFCKRFCELKYWLVIDP